MITRNEIEGLFAKQLDKIGDAELREKTVTAWVVGCERGNWQSLEELRRMPFTLLEDCHGISFIEHTIAVTEGAWSLARAQVDTYEAMPYGIDFDRLVVGGILHDVGKLLEIEPDGAGGFKKSHNGRCMRHPISGAILAAELGFSDEVVNTIACHAGEGVGKPQVIETVFIHQADYATFDPLVMMGKGSLIQ